MADDGCRDGDECPICLEAERERCTLPCLHHACFRCMAAALAARAQCPVCRRAVNTAAVARRGPDTARNRRRGTFATRAAGREAPQTAPRAACPVEGCGRELLERNVGRHLDTVHRQYRCVRCGGAVEVRHRERHERRCPRVAPTAANPFPYGLARCTCAERAHMHRNGRCWGCNVRAAVADRSARMAAVNAIDLT